jgi:DNA-binding SARP family transcriptional activator
MPPPPARLSLLGGFELSVQSQRVELPQSAKRLISFLALHPRALMRVFIASTLWTDASEQQANSNLRSVLWRLRAVTPVVEATSTHLSLASWVGVDVVDNIALTRRLVDDGSVPEPQEVRALTDAGELLPDLYDDWLIVERERVRQRRLHSLEAACRQLARAGRFADALEAGLAAVAVEPLRESGHAVVIEAHLAEGNLIEASRQYEQLRDLLREHLGTQPSPRVSRILRDAHVTLA